MKTKSSAGIFFLLKEDQVKGINLLSSLISYRDYTFPIGFEVIKKDMHFCDVKTKKKGSHPLLKAHILEHFCNRQLCLSVKFENGLANN
ncbi:hypothetical protein DB41_CP00160 [Neochlamydia sp. TUME1]|nr:hypothetical protein DB41_CP00160 [Neochlamydia sp. TUME1]